MIPPGMRGYFYPTVYTARCSAFGECIICHGCNKYNPDELACRWCERGHKQAMICKHSPETLSKFKTVEQVMGKMFDPHRSAGSVNMVDLDEHADAVRMAEELGKNGNLY